MSEKSNFLFKGSRNYVQANDMFNWLRKCAATKFGESILNGELQFSVHRFVKNQCTVEFSKEAAAFLNPSASLLIENGEQAYNAFLIETAEPVQGRVEFPENEIAKACSIHEKLISLDKNVHDNIIETIVYMTKPLHYHLFPRDKGRWVITKFSFFKNPPESFASGMKIKLLSNFQDKLTKSEIWIDGEQYGYIFFSLA